MLLDGRVPLGAFLDPPPAIVAPTPGSVFRVSYVSRSLLSRAMRPARELSVLLRACCSNNAALGLSGALVLGPARFAGWLEGPEDAVRALLRTIAADPRHEALTVLSAGPLAAPAFPSWGMALLPAAATGMDDLRLPRGLDVPPAPDGRDAVATLECLARGG